MKLLEWLAILHNMPIPKINAPQIVSNVVSNSKTVVTKAISSVSIPSFPLISAPKVSLPSTDLLTSKLPSTDALKEKALAKLPSTNALKEKALAKLPSAGVLSSAAKAKALAKLPSLPDVPDGMAGIMTPGVDLSKFQAKTMANLISIVPPHIPGKSSLGIAKALKLASAAKSKLGGLKSLASGLNVSALSGVSGLAGGVAGKLGGALSSATGKLGGVSGLAGGVAGKLGGALSSIGGVSGLAGGLGGALSSTTGKLSGAGVSGESVSNNETESNQKSEIPDLTKNTTAEVSSLADKSSQSVPKTEPTPNPISSISPPQNITTSLETNGQTAQNQVAPVSPVSTTINSTTPTPASASASSTTNATEQVSLDTANNSDLVDGTLNVVQSSVKGVVSINNTAQKMYGNDLDTISKNMAKDIEKLTPADRENTKNNIKNFNGTFSYAYLTMGSVSNPSKRVISMKDYISFDQSDFYQFLTGVAEGQFLLEGSTPEKTYNIMVSFDKSSSIGNVTIVSDIYGTGTGKFTRATPPSSDELFDWSDLKYTMSGGVGEKKPSFGAWNGIKLPSAARYRSFCISSNKYFCGKGLEISQNYAHVVTGKNTNKEVPGGPDEDGGWTARIKIDGKPTDYFFITYHPYTLQIRSISVFKLLPKR